MAFIQERFVKKKKDKELENKKESLDNEDDLGDMGDKAVLSHLEGVTIVVDSVVEDITSNRSKILNNSKLLLILL